MEEVELGSVVVPLVLPDDPALCYDVVLAAGNNAPRAFYAALGLCWRPVPAKKRRKDVPAEMLPPDGDLRACKYDVLTYGGQVFNSLRKRGHSPPEILAAGTAAFNLMAEQVIDPEELEDEVGNSDGPEEGPADSPSDS